MRIELGLNLSADSIITDRVHRRILEVLLEEEQENPSGFGVHRSVMKKALDVPEKSMDFNMTYLKKMNLLDFVPVPNYHWLWAKITGPGIAAIEDTLLYEYMLKKSEVGER